MKNHIPSSYGTAEKALARIRDLEAQLGIELTETVQYIEPAWERISILEDVVAARTGAPPPRTEVAPTQRPATKPLYGLARAMAANSAASKKYEPQSR